MDWRALPVGIAVFMATLLAWAAAMVALGDAASWTIAVLWSPWDLYYANVDHGAAAAWLGLGLVLGLFTAAWRATAWWGDALGVGAVLLSIRWWHVAWLLEDAFSMTAAVLMLVISLGMPWLVRGGIAAGLSALVIPVAMMVVWSWFYLPLEPLFGLGPTGPRPWSIVVYGLLVVSVFIAGSATVLRGGRRLPHSGHVLWLVILGVVAFLMLVLNTSHGIGSIYTWGWAVPVALWAGAVAWLVRQEPSVPRWSIWGIAAAIGLWIAVQAIVGLV